MDPADCGPAARVIGIAASLGATVPFHDTLLRRMPGNSSTLASEMSHSGVTAVLNRRTSNARCQLS
jgi:hypothetical protein